MESGSVRIMIELEIPREIKDYKTKYVLGLTFRQNVSMFLAIVIGVFIYTKGKVFFSEDVRRWIVIGTSIPIISIGFFRYNSMYIEEFIRVFIQTTFIYPRKRIYQTENPVSKIRQEYLTEERNKELKAERHQEQKRKFQKRRERLKSSFIFRKVQKEDRGKISNAERN